MHELHEAQRKAGREPAIIENEENHHPLQEHSREIREAAKVLVKMRMFLNTI